jgi:transposase
MQNMTRIGLVLAKRVFQLNGMDHAGRTVLRQKVRSGQVLKVFATFPPCLVGMEACSRAHYWAREISAQGRYVRLIPPQYVRPSHKLSTTDSAPFRTLPTQKGACRLYYLGCAGRK